MSEFIWKTTCRLSCFQSVFPFIYLILSLSPSSRVANFSKEKRPRRSSSTGLQSSTKAAPTPLGGLNWSTTRGSFDEKSGPFPFVVMHPGRSMMRGLESSSDGTSGRLPSVRYMLDRSMTAPMVVSI